MKSFYLLTIAIFACLASFAIDNTVVVNNGSWSTSGTWSLGHTPQNGETIVIPAGYTLVIDENIDFTASTVRINVYGNIYFKVGKLHLSPASVVAVFSGATITTKQGNPSDRITIGGVMKYSGSEGTVTGPIVLSLIENATLPVKYVAYNVSRNSNGVSVEWSTSEEVNADKYIVERSEDGANWRTIGQVKAAGNSSIINKYAFYDNSTITKVAFYRVKQIDIDGHFVYTSIKSVRVEAIASTDVKVSNNANNLVIEFAKQLKGSVVVRIVSLSGQVMAQKTYSNPAGNVVLDKGSFKGNYIIAVSNGQNLSIARQIML